MIKVTGLCIVASLLVSSGISFKYSFDNVHQYETSLINVMNNDWVKSRETVEASGEEECMNACGMNEVGIWSNVCTCQCIPGTVNISNTCQKAKQFPGEMVQNIDFINEEEAKDNSYRILYNMYNNTPGFEDVQVLSVRNGSIYTEFLLLFEPTSNVTSDRIYEVFDKTCNDNTSLASNSSVNCTESEKLMRASSYLLCESSGWSSFCDNTTTICEPTKYGNVSCNCSVDYYTSRNASECYDKKCEDDVYCNGHGNCFRTESGDPVCVCDRKWTGITCTSSVPYCEKNSECNSPFGTCGDNNTCNCMWGFQGDYCYQPWMFTLTIVAAGLGLIIIILIIVFACQSRKGKKKKKKNTVLDDDDSLEYDHPLENLPKADYSSYQPRMMRAQVPTHLYSSSITERPQQAPGSSTSTFNHERQETPDLARGRASYTNYGYASVDKTKRQSGRYGSPPRGSNEYF